MNSSASSILTDTKSSGLSCDKDALTDFFGWMLQGVLASLAFTCLIGKRFCEPPYVRRPWETWWYDTSKQGIGALVIHMTNVYLAPLFQGDPCTWYIINFLLDSTIGLFIVYVGIRLCQYLSKRNQWETINFGVYTAPKSWLHQTWIYIGLMAIVKLITTLFIQLDFWDNVKDFVLSPFSNPKIERAITILVIPFFVNMLIFWVTDNFLMRHNRKHHANNNTSPNEPNLLQRVRVRYRSIRKSKDNESESEALISGDDEVLLTSNGAKRTQRTSVVAMA